MDDLSDRNVMGSIGNRAKGNGPAAMKSGTALLLCPGEGHLQDTSRIVAAEYVI